MKIKTKKKDYQVTGATSKRFSVDTNDTMVIKLLRDKMYKNKIGAVAREISSNSRDANREANRGDSPIVISIETEENLLSSDSCSISFQDNGIGISPERMDSIFLKYGGSTKRESDKFTGGFGIGAKTPFAYTDNFFISTIVEESGVRTEYLYQAIITSDGNSEVSRMIELGSNATTEQTGTKITVPLKSDEDRIKFEKEVVFVTTFWSIKPTLKNFTTVSEEGSIVYEDDNIISYSTHNHSGNSGLFNDDVKYVALIDEIPYPINHETLGNELNIKLYRASKGIKWLFKFNTGDITVSGSREDIEYIESNLKTIHNMYLSILEKGRELIKEYQSTPKTFLEACIYANDLRNKTLSYNNHNTNAKHNNKYSQGYIKFLGETVSASMKENEGTGFGTNNEVDKICLPLFEGEQTVTSLSFETFVIDNYEMDNNNRMVKNKSYRNTNPSSNIWNKKMFLVDTPKLEPTRNARLKLENAKEGYVLIKKLTYNQWENTKYGKATLMEYNRLLELDNKLFDLINLKTSNYSEVEKLKKSKAKGVGRVDTVNVNIRVLQKSTWESVWNSKVIKYDKKEKTFVNEVEAVNGYTSEATVRSICYVSKEKLSDFKTERYSNSVNGLTPTYEAIRKVLLANGVQTVGISNSKLGYFKDVPTLVEAFATLVENDKSQEILNCVKYCVIRQNGLHHSKLLSNIKVSKKVRLAINGITELYKQIENEKETNLKIQTILDIFNKQISNKTLNSLNIELGKDFKKDLNLCIDCLNKNPFLSLVLNVKSEKGYGGYRINRGGEELIALEKYLMNGTELS